VQILLWHLMSVAHILLHMNTQSNRWKELQDGLRDAKMLILQWTSKDYLELFKVDFMKI